MQNTVKQALREFYLLLISLWL